MKMNMKRLLKLLCALPVALTLTADLSALPQGSVPLYEYLTGYVFPDGLLSFCALIAGALLLRVADGKKAGVSGCVMAFIMAAVYTVSGIFGSGNTVLPAGVKNACVICLSFAGAFFLLRALVILTGEVFQKSAGESGFSRVKTALILFALYLPYLFLLWPGAVHPDTYDQLQQFMGTLYPGKVSCGTAALCGLDGTGALINNFQPVFHTLLTGGFYALFRLFGNGTAGLTVYLVLQTALAAWIISGGMNLLHRLGVKKGVLTALTLLYGLLPLYPDYFLTTMKDSAFALSLLAALIFLAELIAFPEETARNTRRMVTGALAILMTGLFRSYGLYLMLFAVAFTLIRLRKQMKKALICMGSALLLTAFMLYAIYPLCGIAQAPGAEKRSLMLQQTALWFKEYPDEITEDDRALISEICLTDDLGALYNPLSTDFVKTDALSYRGDWSGFDALWLRGLKEHPGTYLRAALTMGADYWDLRMKAEESRLLIYGGDHAHVRETAGQTFEPEIPGYVEVDVGAWTPVTSRLLRSAVRAVSKLPGLSLLFAGGSYLGFLLLALTHQIRKRKPGKVLTLTLILFGIGLVFAPIGGSSRYLFPVLLTSPLIGMISARMPERMTAQDI